MRAAAPDARLSVGFGGDNDSYGNSYGNSNSDTREESRP